MLKIELRGYESKIWRYALPVLALLLTGAARSPPRSWSAYSSWAAITFEANCDGMGSYRRFARERPSAWLNDRRSIAYR